jgi:hypothetical protein
MQNEDRTFWVAGLFLHQAAEVFFNFTHARLQREGEHLELRPEESWRDRIASITYWHELDHFQSFTCSPYLTFVSDMVEACGSSSTSAVEAVRDSARWPQLTKPIILAATKGECDRPTAFHVEMAARYRYLIHCLLSAPFLSEVIARRITDGARMQAFQKRVDLDFLCESRTAHSRERYFRITPIDLLEASARLHELGHLKVWGASDSQIQDWRENQLFAQYGKVLPYLLGRIDSDLIHACLTLAFRADFFPFLGGQCTLDDIHPVSRFTSMINALIEWRLTHAQGKDAKNIDTRSAFHDRVVESLIERFGRVATGDKFRKSYEALFSKFTGGEIRDLYRPTQIDHIEELLREKKSLAAARDARLNLESTDLYWLWGETTTYPFTMIFLDGARRHERVLNYLDAAVDSGQVQFTIANMQAVSDIILYGDVRLYRVLAAIRVAAKQSPANYLPDVLDELGFNIDWRNLPTVRQSDEDLDRAFTEYRGESAK